MKMRPPRTESGTPWLDAIPSHWHVQRVKDRYRVIGGGTPNTEEISPDLKVSWATPTDFSDAERWLTTTARRISAVGYKSIGAPLIKADGILISCRAPAGKVALPAHSLSFNQGCKGLSPRHKNVIREWFFYVLVDQREQIEGMARGATFLEISGEALKRVVLQVPPIGEQRSIAAWLDLQTSRIDKRIELLGKKRKLLGTLKKSVIVESTFRGLNPGAVLRESGIGWLGAAPAHWQTVRLGLLFQEAADAGREGLPMLTVSIHSGISDRELDGEEMERKVSRSEDKTVYKRVKPGDLVYNQMRAWQGAFGSAQIEGLVSPAYVVARPRRGVVPRFVEYLLRAPAVMEEIRRRSRGITDFRLRLYWDEFKNIRITLPPLDEQQTIADFLDRKLAQIDKQISLIDRLETLLKEQRKALIREAVTGKIDLSNYEPPAQAV